MKRGLFLLILLAGLVAACTETWIPVAMTPRPRVSPDRVQFLESEPARPFEVLGIITPPAGEYDTEAAAVHAMRNEAARRGADAFFIESRTEKGGWSFSASPFGAGGGSTSDIVFRAKAIVWK